MKPNAKDSAPLSRRRFVGLLTAGTAAILAPGGAVAAVAAAGKRPARPAASAAAAMSLAERKEYARQLASAKSTVGVIRKHKMPPGTELASIFKPLRPRRGNG